MIVPFVFTLATYNEAPYLWYFYKWLHECKKEQRPIIAQEIYFQPPRYFAKRGLQPAYDKTTADRFEYDLPKTGDLSRIRKYHIPDRLTDQIIKEKGCISNAYAFLLSQPYQPLMDMLEAYIQDIRKHYSEPIEAFAVLQHSPSLSMAAARHGIPVIHQELGPLRWFDYITTDFWDLNDLYGGNTIAERYQKFCNEIRSERVPVFTGKELLSIFLLKDRLSVLDRVHAPIPNQKIGIALGNVMDPINSSRTRFNDLELLYRMEKKYGAEHLLLRKHPGDPYGAQYPRYSACMQEQGKSPIDFILDSKVVASIGSNVAMEAMFYGRKAYVFAQSPSYYAAANRFDEEPACADDVYLSFFALGYLIPHEMMTDTEYIRWRLSNPSEIEIYSRHLNFYLEKKGIPSSAIDEKGSRRLHAMRSAQQ